MIMSISGLVEVYGKTPYPPGSGHTISKGQWVAKHAPGFGYTLSGAGGLV